jgi:hypothetical protein
MAVVKRLAFAALALALATPPADAKPRHVAQPSAPRGAAQAPDPEPIGEAPDPTAPSEQVVRLAGWVLASHDNGELPFLIVDKIGARLFLFDAHGQPLGAAPVLVGLARGDDSAPGVGERELSDIAPEERTTPAGRFVASFGKDRGDRRVLWVDYVDAISLHAVVTSHPAQRRLERLASPDPEDHRISSGCINVPAAFYANLVAPTFEGAGGVVYILPDTKALEEVFPALAAHQLAASAPGGRARAGDVRDAEAISTAGGDGARAPQ